MRHRISVAGTALVAVSALVMPGTAAAGVTGAWNLAYQSPADGLIRSIAAISNSDSWAVAERGGSVIYQPFIRHFDGSSWRAVTIPGAGNLMTYAVAASSARNVWILGARKNDSTVAYRYDGSRWHQVPVPGLEDLQDPVVLSPANVWAIAESGNLPSDVLHWNGHRWHGYSLSLLPTALSASAAGNVWVAGLTFARSTRKTKATAYRWNGTRWRPVTMPHPVADYTGVTASSPSDVWIGWYGAITSHAMHWDGHHWQVLAMGNIGAGADIANIVPDGHGGDWFGAFARWTGHTWIAVPDVSGTMGGDFGPVSRIPGTSSFWMAAGVINTGSSRQEPTIYRYDLG